MPQYGFERARGLRKFGAAVGIGQSVVGVARELGRQAQQNRLLTEQIAQQRESMRIGAMERAENRVLQMRQWESLDALRKAQIEALGRPKPIKGLSPQQEMAQTIYKTLSVLDPETLSPEDRAALSQARSIMLGISPGAYVPPPPEEKRPGLLRRTIETGRRIGEAVAPEIGRFTREMERRSRLATEQLLTTPESRREKLTTMKKSISQYGSKKEARDDVVRLVREGRIPREFENELLRTIRIHPTLK